MSVIPFSPDEMKPVGMYPGFRGAPGNPILNYPISTRENFKLWMDKKAMWMPSSQELAMWNPGILADNVARAFVMEGSFGLPTDLINKDYFGIDWEYVPTVNGAIVHPGSPKVPEITEWEKYIEFPNLDDLDWASAAKLYEEKGDQTRPMRTA
ncbi:MAG: hypothetical protein HUJ75_00800, partial [Parasporobacterium sp.]|nr:hypothetical protein [Parasporobacterium sp.]